MQRTQMPEAFLRVLASDELAAVTAMREVGIDIIAFVEKYHHPKSGKGESTWN